MTHSTLPEDFAYGDPSTPESFDFSEWGENGLLWLINSTVFWPRGFSLALLGYGKKGTGALQESIGYTIAGDGSEQITVSSKAVSEKRSAAVEKLFADLRRAAA